jgi:hypothetical protein
MNNVLFVCSESNNYSSEYIKATMKSREIPDVRLDLIKNYLKGTPFKKIITIISKYCDKNYEQLIEFNNIEHLSNDKFNYYDLELSVYNALLELLSPLFPDIIDNDSDGRLYRASNLSYVNRYIFSCKYKHKGDELTYYEVLMACQQKVSFMDIPKLYVNKIKKDADKLNNIISYSNELIGKLYLFTKLSENEISAYIIGTKIEPYMQVYLLKDAELELVASYSYTNLIEWSDYIRIENFEIFPCNLNIHIDINIMDFIEQYINKESSVSWTFVNVSFSNFPITYNDGVIVCIFKIKNIPFEFFCVANSMIIEALFLYTDEFIGNKRIIKFDKSIASDSLFSDILSHPAFKFFVFGINPKEYI